MTNALDGVNSWLYHLGDVDAVEAARIGANNAGLVVIDYAHDGGSGSVAHTPAELEVMRGGNDKLIVSYLSIGEAEDYRPYWQSSWNTNPPDFLSASNPEWPDNYKVKYWDPEWQAIIFDYVDDIVASGFNGVYMDIIDAYQYWEDIDPVPGMNYAQEMADFVAAIKAHAEQRLAALGDTRDFVIMGQNGEELLDNPTYLNALDGVGKEDLRFYYPNGSEGSFKPTPDSWYSGSQPYLEQAEAAGVQVFVVEYMTQARQTQYSSMLASEIQYLRDHGIPLYVSEDRDLTGIYPQPGGGDPNIYGTAVGEIVNGTAFNDVIYALAGNDDVSGLGGDDVLIGGGGADILRGGAGDDTASYATAAVGVAVNLLTPAANTGEAAGDTFVSIENIFGSAFWDVLAGDNSANSIFGVAGDDVILGYGGIDMLIGGIGNDILDGGSGSDVMRGGSGNDNYYVDNIGDVTDETTDGGGIGDYVLATVSFTAAAGIERIYLQGAADINATGRDGQVDFLIGNSGNNVLDGKGGIDTMRGGLGNDNYYVDNIADVTDETTGGGGIGDYVLTTVSFTAAAGIERIYLQGAANINATGRDGQVDFLLGNSGNNALDGKGGIDTMRGGLGNDTYYVDNAADVTDEVTGGGGVLDQVFSTVSYTAAAGIERLTLQGAADINATGRDGQADYLIGNSGNNVLDGKGGIDTMRGGLGNDTYYVDNAADVTDEVTGGGGIGDYVFSSVSYTAAAGIERIYLQGAANINATGRDGQVDYLIGNSGDNILNGKGGNDNLQGNAGQDTYRFDTAPNAATNQDQIIGFSSVDDKIELDNAVFTALGFATGPLAASMFQIGAAANDMFDRIIYNNATGALLYDADGNGGGAAIQFASLTGAPALALGDLFVI